MDSRNALSSKSVHAGASGTALMRLACIVLVSANLAGVSAQRRDAELEAVDDRARRQMVVADAATKVPVRDVLVYTDKGQEARTAWDGSFALPDSFARLTFRHPHYEKRYILSSELRGDTVWLLPNHHAVGEVVIWGRRRFDERMSSATSCHRQSPQVPMCWRCWGGSTTRLSVSGRNGGREGRRP